MQDNETAAITAEATDSAEETASSANAGAPSETAENNENQSEEQTAASDAVTPETAKGDESATPSETESAETEVAEAPAEPEEEEEITYHAVQKEDSVTAIWEMQGRKHLRTIDPRSREGAEILRLFTAEEGEEAA